ncbi:hypothetical protein BIWAKO_04796 [Bosea sp. BIWAKO-01]|nr:hypothetical protein BIWAKO_04796 [Bosea sp. BIWAKO-01]
MQAQRFRRSVLQPEPQRLSQFDPQYGRRRFSVDGPDFALRGRRRPQACLRRAGNEVPVRQSGRIGVLRQGLHWGGGRQGLCGGLGRHCTGA